MNQWSKIACICMIVFIASPRAAIIRIGDVLDIAVHSRPEFSGRYTVSESGTIEYPLLADEAVINVTTSELMNSLTFRLAKYVDNPLVTVTVVENPEITVKVLGLVAKPGPVATYEGASIQEILQGAGGPEENADLERIRIEHASNPQRGEEYFDLKAFYQMGETRDEPVIRDKDKIIVLAAKRDKKIKVIGAVKRPGFFEPETRINVFELIYMAGGPAEKADLSRVRRFFRLEGKTMEEILNIQEYIDKGNMDEIPIVAPGDVIIVYSRWFDWKTLLSILNNTLLFIVTIKTFGGVFN